MKTTMNREEEPSLEDELCSIVEGILEAHVKAIELARAALARSKEAIRCPEMFLGEGDSSPASK